MKNQTKAYIYAFIAVLIWSTMATAFKVAFKSLCPELVLFYASVSATIILFVFYYLDKNTQRLNISDFKKSFWAGLFNPFIYYLILFEAYSLLPAQIAQPLNYTWPLVLSLFSTIFLKQKLRKGMWIGLFISFIGVIIISTQSFAIESLSKLGIFLAIFSSVIWSAYWIINIKDKRVDSQKLFLNFLIGSIFILMYILIKDIDFDFNQKGVLASVYIGLFEMGIAFFLWMKALKLSSQTAKINNLVFLSPFLSFFFIALVLKESIHLMSIVGLIIIILGIVIQKLIK